MSGVDPARAGWRFRTRDVEVDDHRVLPAPDHDRLHGMIRVRVDLLVRDERRNEKEIARHSSARARNCSGKSDWNPSERARSGFGCTSTINPAAPAATAAKAIGCTLSRLPVPWLGSTMIGKWLRRCTAGTTLRSSV